MTNFEKLDEAIGWAEKSAQAAQSVPIEETNLDADDEQSTVTLNGEVDGLIWHQDIWAQEWSCGTACCLAGWAALQDGWKPGEWDGDVVKGGVMEDVVTVALDVLGLDYSDGLFGGNNTTSDLKRIRDDLAEAEGVPTKWR